MNERTRECEIAWAAGLFEGEGCFTYWNRKSGWVNPSMALSTTDGDVLDRFVEIVGCGKIYTVRKPTAGGKTLKQWTAAGSENMRHIYELFKPWLGERRIATVEAIFKARAEWEASRDAALTCERCGEEFKRKNLRGAPPRFCSKNCRDLAWYQRQLEGSGTQ